MRNKLTDYELGLRKEAHKLATKGVINGTIQKKPCEVCGKIDAVAHHDDYLKPLDVRWLCRTHHGIAHRKPENISKNYKIEGRELIGFRIDSPMLNRLKNEAKKQGRSLSDIIVRILEQFLRGGKK